MSAAKINSLRNVVYSCLSWCRTDSRELPNACGSDPLTARLNRSSLCRNEKTKFDMKMLWLSKNGDMIINNIAPAEFVVNARVKNVRIASGVCVRVCALVCARARQSLHQVGLGFCLASKSVSLKYRRTFTCPVPCEPPTPQLPITDLQSPVISRETTLTRTQSSKLLFRGLSPPR